MGASFYFVRNQNFHQCGGTTTFSHDFLLLFIFAFKTFFFFFMFLKNIFSAERDKVGQCGERGTPTKLVGTCQGRASPARGVPTGPDQPLQDLGTCSVCNGQLYDRWGISSFCFTLYSL